MKRVIVLLSAIFALGLGGCASEPVSKSFTKIHRFQDGTKELIEYRKVVDSRCKNDLPESEIFEGLVPDGKGGEKYAVTVVDVNRPVCPYVGQPPAGVMPVQGTYQPATPVYVPAPVQYDVARPVYVAPLSPRAAMPSVSCIRYGTGCPGSN